jgi:hypothetical protein
MKMSFLQDAVFGDITTMKYRVQMKRKDESAKATTIGSYRDFECIEAFSQSYRLALY